MNVSSLLSSFLSARRLRTGILLALGLNVLASAPLQVTAQSAPEPIMEQLRSVFDQPGLKVGVLLKAVGDPGIDDQVASMRMTAARLRVSGDLDRGFRYDLQTNFAAAPSLLDARVGWASGPSFAIDAGRFKTPFSREFLTGAGSLDFVDRARVVQVLAPNRQLGVQLSGQLNEYVAWAAGAFTGPSNTPAGEPLGGVFRLEGTSIEIGEGRLSLAAQAAAGQDGAVAPSFLAFRGDGSLYGLDGRFESGRFLLSGEYIRAEWEPNFGLDQDAEGLFLTAGWRLEEAHQVLARWDRYRGPAFGAEADDALVLGYNVWPTSVSEVQVNGIFPLRDSALPYRLLVNFQIGF